MSNPSNYIDLRILTCLALALLISCAKPSQALPQGYKAQSFSFRDSGQLSVVVIGEEGEFINKAEVVLTNQHLEYKKRAAPKPDEVSGDVLLVDSDHPIKLTKQTDTGGQVIFKGLKSGDYFLMVFKPGYPMISDSPKILKGCHLEVVLRPKRVPTDSGVVYGLTRRSSGPDCVGPLNFFR